METVWFRRTLLHPSAGRSDLFFVVDWENQDSTLVLVVDSSQAREKRVAASRGVFCVLRSTIKWIRGSRIVAPVSSAP